MNLFKPRESRTERIVVLLTPTEKEIVQKHADRQNLSMSEFLRLAILAMCGPPPSTHN